MQTPAQVVKEELKQKLEKWATECSVPHKDPTEEFHKGLAQLYQDFRNSPLFNFSSKKHSKNRTKGESIDTA